MFRYLFFCVLFFAFSSCDNNKIAKPPPPPPPPPVAPAQTAVPYPSLTNEIAKDLYERCDFIDYIFYDPSLPMSISLDELKSVRSTFGHISADQAMTNNGCKAMGRVVYQSKGEIILEADFYLSPGCNYYVFLVDGKKTYANAMSENGIKFFTNNIKQAKASVLQKRGGN